MLAALNYYTIAKIEHNVCHPYLPKLHFNDTEALYLSFHMQAMQHEVLHLMTCLDEINGYFVNFSNF